MPSTGKPGSLPNAWQTWLEHPERLWLRQLVFHLHFWVGTLIGAWLIVMSVSGSIIVFRDQLAPIVSVESLARFHRTLLVGANGRVVNGVGAFSMIVLCLTGVVIWWSGRSHWRRSLTIDWHAHVPRITWDVHSALGFWFLIFVAMWGVSGLYLSQPKLFDWLYRFDRGGHSVDVVLFYLSAVHFGRFNRLTQVVWAIVGLVPAVLAFTGIFICCRRVVFHKPSNPRRADDRV